MAPVPLHIKIEELAHHDDDRLEHELRVGVVGVDQPLTVTIESDFYELPRIVDYQSLGGIDLPNRLGDALVFACFESVRFQMSDTPFGELTLPDATRWVEIQFVTADAEIVLAELRRHVTPGLYVDEIGRRIR